MPAHVKKHSLSGYYYLHDGYYGKSLKTKSKSEAEARLKPYNRGKFGLKPIPTVGEYYKQWIEPRSARWFASRPPRITRSPSPLISSPDSATSLWQISTILKSPIQK